MNNDQNLLNDLGRDAVAYTERALNGLGTEMQARVMAGIQVGDAFEVRVRMTAQKQTHISVLLVGDQGQLELHAHGGRPTR